MKTATEQLERVNARERRARPIAHAIFREIADYVARENHPAVMDRLMDVLMQEGIEVLTDEDRKTFGLHPRGPDGWTADEVMAIEQGRLGRLLAPVVKFPA